MAKTLEDRVTRVEEKIDALARILKGSRLKKMKRQIVGLKEKSKQLAKDVGRAKRGGKQ